jgi:diketogulonate reductase-like aldo/keto reductase
LGEKFKLLLLKCSVREMTGTILNLKLNNGVEIPALGFGTFANVLVAGETHSAVLAALEAGYRHLDCAW